MKNSTKVKIINLVKKVLKFKEPEILYIDYSERFTLYKKLHNHPSLTRAHLYSRLLEKLKQSGAIEIIEQKDPFSYNSLFIMRIKVLKP